MTKKLKEIGKSNKQMMIVDVMNSLTTTVMILSCNKLLMLQKLNHYPHRQYQLVLYSVDMVVNQHRQVYEEW